MPYALSLQEYVKPEFFAEAPELWQARLREISPVRSDVEHLGFRKFEPRDDWKESEFNLQPDRPLWAVYSRKPIHLVPKERAEQFTLHWSELPKEKQAGRRAVVSNYQHFMWHSQGVEVRPLWVLQGEFGGTPAIYSQREIAYLRAVGAETQPFGPGFFTPCAFDEKAVKGLLMRDRLVQACGRLDELEKMDRSESLKAEDDAAELLFRETYLDTLSVLMAPNVEFMNSQVGKAQIKDLPPAPKGLENTLATWKDVFKSTGKMPAVGSAPMRKLQVAVH